MTQAAVHEAAAPAAMMAAHLRNEHLRQEERVPAMLPVRMNRGTGVTRNVSSSGVFFETDVDYAPGGEIRFAIEIYGLRGEKMMYKCQGRIVRVERCNGKVGVAARIVASTLESYC